MISFCKELWAFLRSRKKLWMLPLLLFLVLLGVLLLAAQSSVISPLIYVLF